jgi:hypothetical protein
MKIYIIEVQTYPAAQFPLAVPPLLEHSLEVKQVPFRTVLFEIKTKTKTFSFYNFNDAKNSRYYNDFAYIEKSN